MPKSGSKRISLESLAAVATVMELRSLSLAAQRLGLSQPGIAFHVARIERHFGVKLLTRSGNALVLTPAAGKMLPLCLKILGNWERLSDVATDKANASCRLGLTPDVFAHLRKVDRELIARLARDFRLLISDPDSLSGHFERGTLDMIFSPSCRLVDASELSGSLTYVWVRQRGGELQASRQVPASIITGPQGSFQHTLTRACLEAHGTDCRILAEATDFPTLSALLDVLDASALLPEFVTRDCDTALSSLAPSLHTALARQQARCVFACRKRPGAISSQIAEHLFGRIAHALGLTLNNRPSGALAVQADPRQVPAYGPGSSLH